MHAVAEVAAQPWQLGDYAESKLSLHLRAKEQLIRSYLGQFDRCKYCPEYEAGKIWAVPGGFIDCLMRQLFLTSHLPKNGA